MGAKARRLGHLLLWIGFLCGAFTAVRSAEIRDDPWSTIDWSRFIGAVALGAAGVVLLRVTYRKGPAEPGEERSVEDLHKIIAFAHETIERWLAAWRPAQVYEVHGWIDEELAMPLLAFAAGRHAMEREWSLQAYAQVMNEFAQGERWLHRAWSASADGYADEVHRVLVRAKSHFAAAQQEMARQRISRGDDSFQLA